MVLRVINYTVEGPGPAVDLNTFDSLWVGRSGLIAATNQGDGVFGAGSSHFVRVEGAVVGYYGIYLGIDENSNSLNRVLVAADGIVSGTFRAVTMNSHSSEIANFGLIDGGVSINAVGPGISQIHNAGEIYNHRFEGVGHFGTETLLLTNSGTIRGLDESFVASDFLGGAIERIVNSGAMFGNILLGRGADTYDGRGGRVEGTVYGGADSDTFFAGSAIDVFDGGAGGNDRLDFRTTTGVRVYLDGSGQNTGTAAGDTYVSIEYLLGSATGADLFVGTSANNLFRGYGGADTLSGGAGADNLGGGTGIDRLTGGLGDDWFVFLTRGDGGDTITDFRGVAGDNDRFQIAAAFGGGLVAGALAASQFQSRADNLAQDGNDRFIFRTADATLWFDSNGNGAGGLTLVADLQTGAVVTAADILLI